MKIKRIHIDHFGKLKDFELAFTDGFQVIYGKNEDGKSTIMAFIKMMFYGSAGKSSDLTKNKRKKYMPWDGSKMSGSIEFECGGTVYRLERLFGASNATDKISLWNQTTGEKEKIASGTNLGQRFLGMGDTAFEKSVFIGQAGSMAGADKDDEITQKLLNLVSTGDESVSQKKVDTRLQSAKEQLKSKSGKIGILDKQYQLLDSLSDERAQALRREEEKKQMEARRIQMAEEKDVLEKEYQQYQSQYSLQEKLRQLEGFEKLVQKKQKIEKELLDCDNRETQLAKWDPAFVPEVFVSEGEEQIARIQSLKEVASERDRNVQALEEEEVAVPAKAEIPPEQISSIIKMGREQASVQKSLSALKETIQKLSQAEKLRSEYEQEVERLRIQKEENSRQEASLRNAAAQHEQIRDTVNRLKEEAKKSWQKLDSLKQEQESINTQYQVALHNLKSVQQLSSQKIEAAEERLKQAQTPKQVLVKQDVGRKGNVPLFAAVALLLLLSILLGVFLHPACFAGAGIAAVLLVPALGRKQEKEVATTVIDEEEAARAKAGLEQVRRSADLEVEAAERSVSDAESRQKELQEKFARMQEKAEEVQQRLQSALEDLSFAEQKRTELEIKLRFAGEKLTELTNSVKEKQAALAGKEEAPSADLQSLQEQFETQSAYDQALDKQIQSQLKRIGCETLEELQNRQIEQKSRLAKTLAKQENLAGAKADAAQAREDLNQGIQRLISYIRKYIPVSTFEEAVHAFQRLKKELQAIHTARVKINSQLEYLKEEMQGRTLEQIQREAEEIRNEILRLNGGILPEKLEDDEAENLKQKSMESLEQYQKASEEIVRLSSEIKNRYAGQKSVSELENGMERLKHEIDENEDTFACLDMAQKTIMEAFNEIRQSFGPILNKKTAEIFQKLTGGKYNKVMISRNFDINVQDVDSAVSHEWQYLSSGTVDQAYLALRLAVAELLSQNGEKLPLFLDDVFLQYDDGRAEEGLRFLSEYSKKNGASQIVLFTCRQSIRSFTIDNNLGTAIKSF